MSSRVATVAALSICGCLMPNEHFDEPQPGTGAGATQASAGPVTSASFETSGSESGPCGESARVGDGLTVLYALVAGEGNVVLDASDVEPALHLSIVPPDAASWVPEGLRLEDEGIARAAPATKLIDACGAAGAVTLEAWVTLESASDTGQIVGSTRNTSQKNFLVEQVMDAFRVSVGQFEDELVVDIPGVVQPGQTHFAFTFAADGEYRVYLAGDEAAQGSTSSDVMAWDPQYGLAVGNSENLNRHWPGVLHLIAVYCRALSATEIEVNYAAGIDPACV